MRFRTWVIVVLTIGLVRARRLEIDIMRILVESTYGTRSNVLLVVCVLVELLRVSMTCRA